MVPAPLSPRLPAPAAVAAMLALIAVELVALSLASAVMRINLSISLGTAQVPVH